jgi:hypothetical protein
MFALVPTAILKDREAIIQMTDSQKQPIADIMIKYGDTVNEVPGGEKREIESMKLVTRAQETRIRTLSNQFLNVKVHIDADLKNIPEGAALDLNTQTTIDQEINSKFRAVSKSQRLALIDRAGVFTVKKTILKNNEDVTNVRIIFKIQKEWQANSRKDHVKIMRFDETTGDTQILPTRHVGEEEGYEVYTAYSPDGLSTFAVFMVDTIQSGSPAEFKTAQLKRFGFPMLIIVIVGGIFVGTYFSRVKNKPEKKR